MRHHEIEGWALSVLDRVTAGGHVEDARVELKREWPKDIVQTARQIAGHANAARGAPILWLVGIDEKAHQVQGAAQQEFASWWNSVRSPFDGLSPRVVDVVVPYRGASIVALMFETDRAPFVVSNPKGGQVAFEVPWRDGTAVRTARREDLLRILVPTIQVPEHEVLSATLSEGNRGDAFGQTHTIGIFEIDMFIVPRTEAPVYVLFDRCNATFRLGDANWRQLQIFSLGAPGAWHSGDYVLRTILWNPHGAKIEGAGRVALRVDCTASDLQAVRSLANSGKIDLEIIAALSIAGGDLPLKINARLVPSQVAAPRQIGRWTAVR